jgi:IS4 transposase
MPPQSLCVCCFQGRTYFSDNPVWSENSRFFAVWQQPQILTGPGETELTISYLAFKRLYQKEIRGERYATRPKYNTNFKIVRLHPDPTGSGVSRDWAVKLDSPRRRIDYPRPSLMVEYEEPDTGKQFRFLISVWALSAHDVAEIYKARWQVELPFKWRADL